jgi:hypothetical protein
VVGDECHIVSSKPDGPRHRHLDAGQVDAYDNLILLCPSDHVTVDKQPLHYTEQKLRQVKRAHEEWVRDLPGPTEVRIRRERSQGLALLDLAQSGRDLMTAAAGADAAEMMTPEFADTEEADLVGGFLQGVQDWAELWDQIPIAERLRTEIDLTNELKELKDAGFIVYCARRRDTIQGGPSGPLPWYVAIIGVFRIDDPQLSASLDDGRSRAQTLTADQAYWREQIVARAYPLIGQVETYADFEINAEIRGAVAHYARTMRGTVKGKFREFAAALPSDAEEERVLTSGTRAELIELLKTYGRLFD